MLFKLRLRFSEMFNYVYLNRKHIKHGINLKIRGIAHCIGNIELGDNVVINSGYIYNPIGGQERAMLITVGSGKIEIGNDVGISNSTIVAKEFVKIESYVKIGGSCKIYDNDFHSMQYEKRVMNEKDNDYRCKPVLIQQGAFIGAHSIILKGVTIGKHAIVGAGSVVTKSIPDDEIWAGNPARFIRKIGGGVNIFGKLITKFLSPISIAA